MNRKDQSMRVVNESSEYVSDAQSGDLVDFGHYGQLYIVRDLGDSYWVSDRPGDERGWSIKKYLAKRMIKSVNDNEDEEVDESVRVRVTERSERDDIIEGMFDELFMDVANVKTYLKNLLDKYRSGDIDEEDLINKLNDFKEKLSFNDDLDEAIPAIVAAIGQAVAGAAATAAVTDK